MKKLYLLLWVMASASIAHAQTCTTTITSYPYFQNFDSGAGGWVASGTNSSWALGTPSASIINSAASGSNSWATNLSGNYNNSENSQVLSPCFNFSTLVAPIFQAKIWWHSEASWDGTVLQSSIDNGLTWQVVGAFGDPNNWYTDNSLDNRVGGQSIGWAGVGPGMWVTAKHALTGLGGQSNVRLRFAFGSDGSVNSYNGFAFDDVTILETPTLDLQLAAITSPVNGCGLSSAENVCVTITNRGIATQSNFPVSYQIGNNPAVTETVTTSIAPGASFTYCFNQKANLSTPGTFTFTATTLLAGDGDPSNNSATKTVTSIPVISTFPYSQNFENGNGGWTSTGTNSSWALGTPAASVINSAASGVNAWVTNLTGNYNGSENSQVVSPCFNFSALPGDPDFEMKVWWNSEASWDGAVLQSSINGGATWQVVGAFGDPNNWYNDNSLDGRAGGQSIGWAGNPGSGGWVKAKHKLNGLGGQSSVLLRVAFGSDGSINYEGFAFDDIRIGDNTNNVAINSFVPLTQVCGFGATEKVEVILENLGSVAVSNYTVQYRLTNPGGTVGQWITGPAGPTLQPDTQVPYIFTNAPADLTAAGPYSIEVRITNNQGTDPEPANNTIVYNITNALYTSLPVTLDFETPPTSVSSARTITKSRSAITEATGVGKGTGKGLIMDGVDHAGWEIPVGIVNPWTTNPENFSAVYICLGPANIGSDSLKLTLNLKQYYKTTHYNTNFRITVNGQQVGPTYRPPFGGYAAGTTPPWDTIVVDLTSYKNKGGIQIGLESSVKEPFANGAGTANVLDNIMIERITVLGTKENILQSNLVVFPNPSNGLFNLKIPASTRSYSVEVTDLTGKVVKQQVVKNNSGSEQLNLNGAAKGIYILRIASEGNVATRKLILE